MRCLRPSTPSMKGNLPVNPPMKKETPMKLSLPRSMRRAVALLLAAAFVAAACGGSDESPAAAQDDGFPLTFTNCDTEFTLDAPPERVMLMEAAAPSLLFAAGAMDRVIARIESFPEEYYTAEELALLNDIPALVAQHTSTGGVEISVEAIIDHDPDIVIGYDTATLTHDALADVGIQLYVMPPFCDNPPTPSFESILDEVRFYGELFGTSETANASADALEAAVASAADAPVAEGQTAAALYVSSDGSAIYAYSSLGMVHPLMEALGMTNVFAELSERVPEVSIEEVIGRNPEILVLLYDDFGLTPDEISALVTDLPGADSIAAVEQGAVYPLLFNWAEPPTPLVVKGLSELSAQITQ
ncbi:MAG: ABC transporter substrate-binding protein [Acidimicrobiales bacterium]|nr:ABC transporter substrate-binding protein [Acidimicrobiales bacterium]MYH74858.1 ABC transporter substrate-binding protein [Acidimicrobiales bacterium]MYK71281.1 ABC transporter substrate-binding protein [Acidimicrobiales bacterium]